MMILLLLAVLAGGHEGLQARLKALDLELALTPTAALHLERADIKRRLGKLDGGRYEPGVYPTGLRGSSAAGVEQQ